MQKQGVQYLIGGILTLVIAMGIGRFSYTVILPYMQEALQFDKATAGFLATSNYLGYLVGALVTGRVNIWHRRIPYLRIALVVSIVTTALMGVTEYMSVMYVLRFVSGVTSAFLFVVASSLVLDQLATFGKAHLSGIFYSGVGIGIALSAVIVSPLHSYVGWHGVWIGLAIFSVLLMLPIYMMIKPSHHSQQQKAAATTLSQKLPPASWMKWLILSYSLEGLGYIVTGTFIVSMAKESATFQGDATLVWFVVGLAAIPSCIIWSKLAKQYGFVRTLLVAMIVQALGILLPAIAENTVTFYISAMLFGGTFMGITTVATTLARQIVPVNSHKILGLLTAGYALGQMVGPSIAGVIANFTNSYQLALVGAAIVVFAGAVSLVNGLKYEKAVEQTLCDTEEQLMVD